MSTEANTPIQLVPGLPPAPLGPLGPCSHPLIRRYKSSDLTRDQRRDCQLLESIRWTYNQMHKQTGFTINQIRTACAKATPRKRSRRLSLLTQAQVAELVTFVCVSAEGRRMSFQKLAEVMDWGVKKTLSGQPF
jgi:hypothetical protein